MKRENMSASSLELDVFKDIPGYKGILKAVLKYQIQLLVEQLSEHVGEESVLLSANISEGTLSHVGTRAGKGFLTDNNDVKRQYLSYCLKRHQAEKRKSDFMSPNGSQEASIHPDKVMCLAPESVATFPVHKKPYFRVQRRNTRVRSGSKQFSSVFSKGVNRFSSQKIGEKVIPQRKYMTSGENELSAAYQGQIAGIEGQRSDEALTSMYEGQRLDECGQEIDPQVIVKTEIPMDGSLRNVEKTGNVDREIMTTVKVEPQDDLEEKEDRETKGITHDIQTFGDGLGHQYSPNASVESEESFTEGNQSFEYLLDQENSEEIIMPWKPEENGKIPQVPSKRKQSIPTRITKSRDIVKSDSFRAGSGDAVLSHTSQSYGDITTSLKPGNSEFSVGLDGKGNQKIGTHLPAQMDTSRDISLGKQIFETIPDINSQRGSTSGVKGGVENTYGRLKGSSWTSEQMTSGSTNNVPKNVSYRLSEKVGDQFGLAKGSDLNWQEECFPPGGMKTYMKTPQIDGLFVSRGEGRYEKLIKCEECGKVCRTSNMARHKKRYCTALPKVTRSRKNYSSGNEYMSVKETFLEGYGSNIYVDNPERQGYSTDLSDSMKTVPSDIGHVHSDKNPTYSLPTTNLRQGGSKKLIKSILVSPLVGSSQNESEEEMNQSDSEVVNVDTGSKSSTSGRNKSNEDLKKSYKILNNKSDESETDLNVLESQSQMKERAKTRGKGLEKTDEERRRKKESENKDDHVQDIHVKKEPRNSDDI